MNKLPHQILKEQQRLVKKFFYARAAWFFVGVSVTLFAYHQFWAALVVMIAAIILHVKEGKL